MNELSPADVAVLTGNRNNGNNSGWGGDQSWWIIILFLFVFCGWGGNGWGNNGNGSNGSQGGVMDAYVLNSDFATLSRQLDNGFDRVANGVTAVNQGLCDGFYAMNTGMLNGFGNVQNTLCQGFGNLNTAITAQGYETRLGTQNLASQLASCCCDVRQEIADCCCKTQSNIKDVSYNIAMGNNAIQQTLCNNTRDIIENQNSNYRALHDEIVANRIEDKNAQIQAQQNEINALRLSASQQAQNNYLISELKPCPIPAYITCNPYQSVTNTCGCNCGNY